MLLMDVIEHIEDDVGLVGEYVNKVAPGTQFIATVPAFMWLWSGHDVFLEHVRRYTLPRIEQFFRRGASPSNSGAISTPACCLSLLARRTVEEAGHEAAHSQEGGSALCKRHALDGLPCGAAIHGHIARQGSGFVRA